MATTITHDSATRMMNSNGNGNDNTVAGFKSREAESLKLISAIEQGHRDLADLASDAIDEETKLAALVARRQSASVKALNAKHKVEKEHYKAIGAEIKKQEDFVRDTLRKATERNKMEQEYNKLITERNDKQSKMQVVEKSQLERIELYGALLRRSNVELDVRMHAERESLKTGKSMVDVHKKITESMSQQAELIEGKGGSALSEKYNEQMKNMRSESGKFGFEIEGLTKKQSLFIHGMSSVASFFSYRKALELGRKSLSDVAEAADAATEARYRYGTSLSRHDRGVGTYLSDSYKMVSMNADIGLSFARMGLDVDDAKDIIPKMLAKNGTAMRYYADNNNAALTDMAKSAGAFARQTGVSVDEALEMQSELMEAKQMTSKQAGDAMTDIVGDIRGMNNALQDAGFKGALLNVGEMANLTMEAAKNAKTASFNTDAYTKSLVKSAAAARAFGMSEKSAKEYAAHRAQMSGSEDSYHELLRGKALDETISSKYGADIDKGDDKALTAKLMLKKEEGGMGLAAEQATVVASMMIGRKKGINIPMFANKLAGTLNESAANKEAYNKIIADQIRAKGIKADMPDSQAIPMLMGDPVIQTLLGTSSMPHNEQMNIIVGAWREFQTDGKQHGSAVAKKLTTDDVSAKQEAAKKEAGVEGTSANSAPTLARLKNYAQAVVDHPFITGGVATGLGLGTFLAGKGIKNATGGTGMFTKVMGLLGRGGTEAAAGAGANATAGLGSSLVPGLVDNAGRDVTEAATASAAKSGGKTGFRKFMSDVAVGAFKKNKNLAIALGAVTVATGVGAYLNAHSSTDKDKNTQDVDSGSPEAQKRNESIIAWMQQNGVTDPDKIATARNLLAAGQDPATVASLSGVSPEAISQAFDTKTGAFGPTVNAPTWKPPPTGEDVGNTLVSAGVGAGTTTGFGLASKGIAKLAGKETAKEGSKLGAKMALKVGAREIPVLGGLVSGLITGAMTDGPLGRRIFAGVGDALGTLGGQAATVGLGGAVAGTVLGEAGSFGGKKMYDSLFGDNSSGAVDNMSQAQKQLAQQPTSNGGSLVGMTNANPLLSAGGIGAFSNLGSNGNPKLTIPITLDVAGFTQVVQQANSFNLARQTQYSGAKT